MHRGVVVYRDDQSIAELLCLGEIADVAGVNDVEAAVGKHHALAVGSRVFDGDAQLLGAHYAAARCLQLMQRAAQFGATNGGGAELTDGEARREIRKCRRLGKPFACGETCREYRDHGIAGTGNIEDFLCACRQMQFGGVWAKQRHAVLAAGNEDRL